MMTLMCFRNEHFHEIVGRFGKPDIDRFASRHRQIHFIRRDPNAIAVDALQYLVLNDRSIILTLSAPSVWFDGR